MKYLASLFAATLIWTGTLAVSEAAQRPCN